MLCFVMLCMTWNVLRSNRKPMPDILKSGGAHLGHAEDNLARQRVKALQILLLQLVVVSARVQCMRGLITSRAATPLL